MANRFELDNAPKEEPSEILIGEFVQWVRSDLTADYSPTLYRLVYSAISADGTAKITLTSSEDANGNHLFEASSATTGAWAKGEYYWQVEIERISDSARVLDRRGNVQVLPDLATTGTNPRSHAEVMLSKIESILENRADKDVTSYSIGGRSITKMSVAELMDWRNMYRKEVRAERNKRAIANGKSSSTTIKARFL